MKVYNESKTELLEQYDLEKGYLKEDFIVHNFPESHEIKEISHYETIKVYPNGGKDVKKVIDVEGVEYKPARTENERIYIYIPYTAEELSERQDIKYRDLVERFIREKYSLSDELAILRQRDTKAEEFSEYNKFAEDCKLKAKIKITKNN